MFDWKKVYKVIRSVLFTAVITVVCLYALLYLLISIPGVQKIIKEKAETELKTFFKSKVEIGNLQIAPFNEIRIKDVNFYTPGGERCIYAQDIGAAIRLWRLILKGKIEITYVELIGLDAKIIQPRKGAPLNIDFIIKAFKPKEKKEPSILDLKIYNIVIRKSNISFDKEWIPESKNFEKIDFSHLALNDLIADISLPSIKNDDFTINIRRLSFFEKSGFDLKRLSLFAHITANKLKVKDIDVNLPSTSVEIPLLELAYPALNRIKEAMNNDMELTLNVSNLDFSDFKCFLPQLGQIEGKYELELSASGNVDEIAVDQLFFKNEDSSFKMDLNGVVRSIKDVRNLNLSGLVLNSEWTPSSILRLVHPMGIQNHKLNEYVAKLGRCNLNLDADMNIASGNLAGGLELNTEVGKIACDIDGHMRSGDIKRLLETCSIGIDLDASNIAVGKILNNAKLGNCSFSVSASMDKAGRDLIGDGDIILNHLGFNGSDIRDVRASISKDNNVIKSTIESSNEFMNFLSDAKIKILEDGVYWLIGSVDAKNINLSQLGVASGADKMRIKGLLSFDLKGSELEDIIGELGLHNAEIKSNKINGLVIDDLTVVSECDESEKQYRLESDLISGYLKGDFRFSNLAKVIAGIIGKSVPSLNDNFTKKKYTDWANFEFVLPPNDMLASVLGLKVRPGVNVIINGDYNAQKGKGRISVDAPFLIQGKDKLIKNTSVNINLDAINGLSAILKSNVAVKNDRANLCLNVSSFNDNIFADTSWDFEKNKTGKGEFKISANIMRNPLSNKIEVMADVVPTSFALNGAEWKIDGSQLYYSDKYAKAKNFKIWHDSQYLTINGIASTNPADKLTVRLKDINLDYIFDALNINYVTFGGDATGEIEAKGLFNGDMDLRTKFLDVRNFSYNNTVLGEAKIASRWDNAQQMVRINADIRDGNVSSVKVDGGIYATRDSLSLDMEASHVNIALLKPFMEAFTSDVGGRASGKIKLFGNFKDIDLTGSAFADSIYMKVDYTNVYYHARDSVYFIPGMIVIPPLKVYDMYGNSAQLDGYVKHRYFHDPEFRFNLNDAKNILGFDTSPSINPLWYGKIFASGSGRLWGQPGVVRLNLDMTTEADSQFTFSMDETQTASEYTFLTFSDSSKKSETVEVKEDFESKFYKDRIKNQEESSSLFAMDLRCSITNVATLNLIMDPKTGDKIVAHGSGPMQISYNTSDDEMKIYGKYTLSEGNYNFNLQDLILRDFKIQEGSNISFNGDVMKGIIDIVAAYRVNTNLSDLDKSFESDRDLNRTSVPVDALLKVSGAMTKPEISFDISLPTLTEDVERKVKSIISTEDMMSRQIIYLLALNRFYTPEYMGSSSNGGAEIASVASTTVSSQLSNFLGQLTDKVTLMPSFRSDKGDFSDMEVDVALSSRLLNNRLLINGNFGYRDRTTSQTTFIGDFDLEYLLNKNGNLRLKAYNHFNDQNYYLQSALTTQGLGIIYRKDFDNPFTFLRKRKNKKQQSTQSDKK